MVGLAIHWLDGLGMFKDWSTSRTNWPQVVQNEDFGPKDFYVKGNMIKLLGLKMVFARKTNVLRIKS